ncbi:hypothetical protein AAG570_011925 [Ranatra chinensis]|uniref:Proline-rich transmembrane protein 3/4 domain-containing protein n=1 Tax=Ranatra chinensis TaxID=642074 RepID=A0ABD0YHB6_9HEMI
MPSNTSRGPVWVKRREGGVMRLRVACLCMAVLMAVAPGCVQSEESVVRAVALDRRLADSPDASDIFNKTLASKDAKFAPRGSRTPPTPPTRVMPSYSPPSRAFFTPPLPPEYLHPFADKPTLRGSNSDSSGGSISGRRPIPPPPPFRLPPEELIPIRPPDLAPHDSKKKTLNTPSFKKIPEATFSETSSSTASSNSRTNETFDFVPMISYPSVSRILYGGGGRKHDTIDKIVRIDKEPRTIKEEMTKALVPPVKQEETAPPPPVELPREEEETTEEETEGPEEVAVGADQVPLGNGGVQSAPQPPELPEPRTRHVLGVAWDIHVYLVAALFALLALISFINIIRFLYCKHLLSRGYFLSVHGILFIVGCARSFYLFYDAYNISGSFAEPVSSLLLNMVFPLLTSGFAVLFQFLLSAAEVKALNSRLQNAPMLAVLIVCYLVLNLSVHLYSGDSAYSMLLPLVCQCLFIITCVALGLAYLYLYKSLSQSCVHKVERWSLAHAIRVTLATAMLSVLMAAVQLYGMLGVYEVLAEGRPQPWLWWGFQLSVRVIEVSMCYLMAWAGGMQRDLSTSSSPANDQPPSVEDIYPAICTANQAYTLRSTKQFDDTFPLNSLHHHHHQHPPPHQPPLDRRSIKKHPSLERRLQPSPSMLVAENGFVRFRTMADADISDDAYTTANTIHDYA